MKNLIYKQMGICMVCKKELAEPNKSSCWMCLDKDRQRKQEYRNEGKINPEMIRQAKRKSYKIRAQGGICTKCGKSKATQGRLCIECYVKTRNYINQNKKIERIERPFFGMCYFCGDKIIDGKKVCAKCYKRLLNQNIIKMNESFRNKREKEREDVNDVI